MRVAYVMEMGGLTGGHKLIFEHLTRLTQRGHDTVLYFVHNPHVEWFPSLRVNSMVVAGSYQNLHRLLLHESGTKVATWWRTAPVVAASGGGCYYVQDVEDCYSVIPSEKQSILDTYGLGLRRYTESRWVAQRISGTAHVGVGIDRQNFYPAPFPMCATEVVYHDREHYLKGPELRRQVISTMGASMHFVGYSPWVTLPTGGNEHLHSPSDNQLAERMRHALALLVTSTHEGFCLPAAEAMACGLPVVTTPADGNDFCIDGENCLIGTNANELIEAIHCLHSDRELWLHLREGALKTAQEWNWEHVIDRVEQFLGDGDGASRSR